MQSPENFARKSGRREEKQLVNQLLLPSPLTGNFQTGCTANSFEIDPLITKC